MMLQKQCMICGQQLGFRACPKCGRYVCKNCFVEKRFCCRQCSLPR